MGMFGTNGGTTDAVGPSRASRLGPILMAATALLCVATLFAWSVTDAEFRRGVYKAKHGFGIEHFPSSDTAWGPIGAIMDGYLARFGHWEWSPLGQRAAVFSCLMGLGLTCTLALVLLTIFRFTTLRAFAACVILVAWGAFYATRPLVDEWRIERQVRALLPQLEQAGEDLDREWPQASGVVRPGIRFIVVPGRFPDVLALRDRPKYPAAENVGLHITRGADRVIRFSLSGAYEHNVEYHPGGTTPSGHRSTFGLSSVTPIEMTRLKENWYLVRYGTP